jgi:hypothetical protein
MVVGGGLVSRDGSVGWGLVKGGVWRRDLGRKISVMFRIMRCCLVPRVYRRHYRKIDPAE